MKITKNVLLSAIIAILSFTSSASFAQSWTSIDGGGDNGSISDNTLNSVFPSVAVLNGELYVIWQEKAGDFLFEVRVKKYNGSTWIPVGNTAGNSLIYSCTSSVMYPKIVSYNNALYAAWSGYDAGIDVVHVKKYDGSSWTFTQNYSLGDGRSNINTRPTANAKMVDIIVYNNELYATFLEQDGDGHGIDQVRVVKFDGNYWSNVDGNGPYGINYASLQYAYFPTLCVFNNALYAAWQENNSSNISQLRVKRYDGGGTWTFVDGGGVNGLNYDNNSQLGDPMSLASYSGKMYLFWSEDYTVRAKQYDGSSWTTAVDGGSGWNHNSAFGGFSPSCYSYDKLYVAWEQNPVPRQVRAASYDGTTKTFIDGNAIGIGINNTTTNRAHTPKLIEYNGDLVAVWCEENTSTSDSPTQIRAKKYSLPPIVQSVSVPANGTYISGQTLNFIVNFNKTVTVAGGTPYIPITLNTGGTVNCTYSSGTGTSVLTFRYTVGAGNADPDGLTVGSTIVLPDGCTLRDASSVDASLTLNSVGSTTSVLVDGVAPTVSSINRQTPATTPTNATSLVYRVTFSKTVTGVGTSDFSLTTSGGATGGTIASVTTISGSIYDVTVNSLLGYGTFRLDLNSSGTGIIDTPGNPINGGYTAGQTYTNTYIATLTTQAVSNIGSTNAIGNGNITDLGYPNPTAYGICYGTTANPDITGSKVDKGTASTTGAFTAQITGLTPGTEYHARAFATNSSGTVYGSDEPFTTATTLPEPGNALNFDGADDYVVATDIDNSLTAFTIEAWVKWDPTTTSDVQFICGKGIEQMEIHTGGGAGANGVRFIPTTGVYLDAANVLATGIWTHVAAVYQPSTSTAKMYINGVEASLTKSGTGNIGDAIGDNTTLFNIGRRSNTIFYFKGSMDEVRVWNTVRSQANIQSDRTTAISASPGLLCSYNFNEGTAGGNNTAGSALLPDLTGNGNNGTLTNFALTGSSSNWVESYAMVVPTATAASDVTETGFTANWTAPSLGIVDNYLLDVASDAAFTAPVSGSPFTIASPTQTKAITGLASGTAYYYCVRADKSSVAGQGGRSGTTTVSTLFPVASTFQTDGNWSVAGNWSNGLPGSSTNVTIAANCTIDGNYSAGNVSINSSAAVTVGSSNTLTVSGNLALKSDASGTASLINNGTLTVGGTTTAERFMTGNQWHIVSPTAAGGSISTFIQAAGNAIPSKSGSYGMMDYNETGNSWNSYYTSSTSDNLISGKGYSVRRTADGTVTFTGTLTSGTKTVNLTKTGTEGWNCVGNPYPSAIYVNTAANATNNFLKTNAIDATNLDGSYACIYVWDQDALGYKILGNSSFGVRDLGQNVFQSGQGFFVKANNGSSSIQFTPAMQVHSTGTALKSGQVSWPGFELTATTAKSKASTVVAFNNTMTKGLDPTYDAGLLRGTSGLELYSRLVDDNGVDFAIQCLPENYSSLVIPIGLESKTGGEITFSAQTVELPAACSIILEDKQTKTFTSLASGATYKTIVSAGTTAVGRFYIHTSNSTTGTSELSSGAFSLKAYPADGHIWIIGDVARGTKASLFDVNGRNLGTFNLQEGSRNSISSASLAPGVYLLNVTEASKKFNTKIVIY
jgi:hypothetical protein